MRVLILGGTSEARSLATRLSRLPSIEVVSSLAGRVRDPRLPDGAVRVGGFGGVTGLRDWLRDNTIRAVVDATHPFAARITSNAAAATAQAGLPFAVVQRPPWSPVPDDRWVIVDTLEDAAAALSGLGRRVFLTIGRQGVEHFASVDSEFLVRAIDPPEGATPPLMTLLLDRGPFEVEREAALMREHHIDVLVTKNSGGELTVAKLTAARELGIPVVMIRRPPNPLGVTVFDTVDKAERWLLAVPV
ncbi:cobalt-precorrin-6A reductase [Rhodococcus daqingensis]|uniref:Cobalt-precorrin-6A reductase n=1 Tax=Rhodococcus daqingensis TaxID=2479363 RepID=A0ABW2S143_9NOCA